MYAMWTAIFFGGMLAKGCLLRGVKGYGGGGHGGLVEMSRVVWRAQMWSELWSVSSPQSVGLSISSDFRYVKV